MQALFGTVFLTVAGLFFFGTSWSSFTQPGRFGQRLGLTISGADGSNEIRAQYGGFFLAVAVVNALVLAGILTRRTGYVVNAAVFGGLIFGRLTSLALDGGFRKYGATISALFFIDGAGFLLSVANLILER